MILESDHIPLSTTTPVGRVVGGEFIWRVILESATHHPRTHLNHHPLQYGGGPHADPLAALLPAFGEQRPAPGRPSGHSREADGLDRSRPCRRVQLPPRPRRQPSSNLRRPKPPPGNIAPARNRRDSSSWLGGQSQNRQEPARHRTRERPNLVAGATTLPTRPSPPQNPHSPFAGKSGTGAGRPPTGKLTLVDSKLTLAG